MSETHLTLDKVGKTYRVGGKGLFRKPRPLYAVDDVSLTVMRGETLGLVGESGCGKSTLSRLIMHLERPTAGTVRFEGRDLNMASANDLHCARRKFQMVFQDPYASLNARMSARAILSEALINYRFGSRAEIAARVEHIATQCGLSAYHLDKYPHELSGGQCQRIGIARAIALEPTLIVADEPVSALDVSIQAQIINLILSLQEAMGLTLVFVSHDLSVVAHIADRVAVMYLGRIIELAPVQDLFAGGAHPYTRTLLAAAPRPVPAARHRRQSVAGELPSPLDPPAGCHFRPRCPHAREKCAAERPALRTFRAGHTVACHFAEEIAAECTQGEH
ncbi:MAG: dipeptide ABC transporter ATP-binding protein [Acuticoccus sp.]